MTLNFIRKFVTGLLSTVIVAAPPRFVVGLSSLMEASATGANVRIIDPAAVRPFRVPVAARMMARKTRDFALSLVNLEKFRVIARSAGPQL